MTTAIKEQWPVFVYTTLDHYSYKNEVYPLLHVLVASSVFSNEKNLSAEIVNFGSLVPGICFCPRPAHQAHCFR